MINIDNYYNNIQKSRGVKQLNKETTMIKMHLV